MNEIQFETELIQYLTSGTITKPEHLGGINNFVAESNIDYIVKTKLWKYEPHIKTTEQLWDNFKGILEQHNQNTLDHPLSTVEFNQVKKNHLRHSDTLRRGAVLVWPKRCVANRD